MKKINNPDTEKEILLNGRMGLTAMKEFFKKSYEKYIKDFIGEF